MAERNETVILDFEVDEGQSIESINSLIAANKELRKERNELNLKTDEGKKRAAELNAQIDKNTEKVKNNSSALEKQKQNIGNYGTATTKTNAILDQMSGKMGQAKDALDKAVPGFAGLTTGVQGATRALWAMVANPIGAILAAIAVAVAAVVAYFKQFESVLDVIEDVTTQATAAFSALVQNLDKVASIVGNLLVGNFNKAGQAMGELTEEMKKAADESQRLLDMTRDLEDAELRYRVANAAAANEMKSYVVAAKNKNLSIEESAALLQKASDIENELTRQAVVNANKRAEIEEGKLVASKRAQLEAANLLREANETQGAYIQRLIDSGIFSPEALDPLIAAYEKVEQEASAGLAFQEKIANQQAALDEKRTAREEKMAKERAERAAKEAERLADERARQRAGSGGQVDDQLKEYQKERITGEFEVAKAILDTRERLAKDIRKINEQQVADEKKRAEAQIEIDKIVEEQKLAGAQAVMGSILGLLDEQSAAYKAIATAQTLVSTYTSAQKAYEAAFLPIPTVASPALGVAFAAAAVINGLANVARINGVEFAEGGWTGPGSKYQAVGIVHADEYVVPKHIVNNPAAAHHVGALERMRLAPYADGGFVTRSVSNPINQSMDINRAIQDMQFVLDVRQVTKQQRAIEVKQAISKR